MGSITSRPQNEDRKLLKEEFGIGPYKIEDLNENLMLLDQIFHDTKVIPNRLQLDEFDIYKD
ncbi:MAG: hypothetical protein ACLSV2_09870 [Clostridium sp.]